MELIIFDGQFFSYTYHSIKEELKKLKIIDFQYLGCDNIPEEDYRICYSFNIETKDKKYSLWTNRKSIKNQIERLLIKLKEK